jgi:tetratricopeptide (TPR) repeat protein
MPGRGAILGSRITSNKIMAARSPPTQRPAADYSEAIRLTPKYARAYDNRGLTFYRKHDYSRAIADHSEAIRLDSTLASAYTGRGNAYNARGEIDHADEDFKKARRLRK